MKKNLLIIPVFLCLLISSVLVFGNSATTDDRFILNTHFNIEILDDGRLSDNKMLVDLTIIERDRGSYYIEWKEVYIDPVHEMKVVILKPFFHSTLEGSIKNVIVTKNAFSFVIDLSGQPMGKGRSLQIVGTKKKRAGILPLSEYDLKGSGLWWSEILKESIKRELRSTEKRIVLPYKEVF